MKKFAGVNFKIGGAKQTQAPLKLRLGGYESTLHTTIRVYSIYDNPTMNL